MRRLAPIRTTGLLLLVLAACKNEPDQPVANAPHPPAPAQPSAPEKGTPPAPTEPSAPPPSAAPKQPAAPAEVAPALPTVGKLAPEIVGEDIDGKPMKLSDYRGKVVMLDFWGNW